QIEGPMWSDVHFDHELREGFIHFSLASIGESVSIVPNIFRLYENGSLVDVSGEIARVTYYLGGVEYDTMQNGSLGLFCSFDLSQAINLEIVVELADGVLVSYSFGYEIEVVVARGGGLDELSLDEQGLDELIEDQP
ncbi:MAG: hypothetical protein FWE29_04650, partial [Defluviitaleaceae bacterium]|nr:hypothetical protein [Defluviitaleaceae bacterium]